MNKRKLQMIVFLLAFTVHFVAQAQYNNASERAVIFEEDFDGWTSIEDEGWFTYTQGFNYIDPDDNAINFFKQEEADWMILITPEMDLTDATVLTFKHKRGSSVDGQKLEVGTMTDPTDPSTFELLNIVNIDSMDWTDYGSETILAGITGNYYIAFNVAASSPIPYTYFWIDDVLITDDPVEADFPSYVTDLEITPGPEGANYAMVSWTNPSTEADGDVLTDLDSTVVLRDGEWAYTVLNPVIGGDEDVQISVPGAGLYVFTVTAYNSAGGSVPIYNDPPVWVGLDTPGPPENVSLTVTNNTIANLSWSVPTVGAHGAYFDGVVSAYNIVRADGSEHTVQGDVLTFTEVLTVPGTYSYEVKGVNASGEGSASESNAGAFYFDGLLLAEDFWVSVPALDWEKQNFGQNDWRHWFTDYSGGGYPEMIFSPNPSWPFNGIARMVSPILNSQEYAAIALKFRHYHNWNSNSYSFKIQTTSDGGTTWADVWSIDVDGSLPGESKLVVIDNDDSGSENFQFAFVFEGNSLDLEFLALDEVRLYEAAEVDLVATGLFLPDLIEPNDTVSPIATIENWGYLETNFTAVMAFFDEDNELVYTSVIDSNIPGGGAMELTFENWTAMEGSYVANFTVSASGDSVPDNNSLSKTFDVFSLNAERTLVICEEGTGTWCGFCPGAAMGLDDLVENNWPVAVVAYHKSDDYETVEGAERIEYYNIEGYPTVHFDGIESVVGGSPSESMYETYLPVVQNRLNTLAPASITFTEMYILDNTMTVTVLIESGSPIYGDNIVLHAALTESHIPESWQGLDELNFVERTMFNGSAGQHVNLSDQSAWVTITLELEPEWLRTNSELVVFVQNMDNKEIYNGNKIDLITVAVEETRKWIGVYPNPASEYLTISGCDEAEVNLYNLQGQKVLSDKISGQIDQIDVSSLDFGMYVLEIVINGQRFTEKIIVR